MQPGCGPLDHPAENVSVLAHNCLSCVNDDDDETMLHFSLIDGPYCKTLNLVMNTMLMQGMLYIGCVAVACQNKQTFLVTA